MARTRAVDARHAGVPSGIALDASGDLVHACAAGERRSRRPSDRDGETGHDGTRGPGSSRHRILPGAGDGRLRTLRIDLTARWPVLVRHAVAGTALPPMRVAAISDVHCGGWWATRAMLAAAIDLANAEKPDLAVFAGDAVADRMLPMRRLPPADIAAELSRLDARLGVWAVLGNHDWKDDPLATDGYRTCASWEALKSAGVPVLNNRAVDIGGAWLVGVDSRRARRALGLPGLDDPDAAFTDVPVGAPSILVAHEPDIFAEDSRAALQISGHTHGGQIAPFGWTPVIPSDYGNRFAWGHYRDGGRHLVVSGGLGFVGIPLRVGRPPEITIIDIREERP